jgi:predicted DCC family thiol-disulfide oxidoreductase YuxK
MSTVQLTLYYDGKCPFCTREMTRLAHWDTAGRLAFVDIAQAGFDPAPLGKSMNDLNRAMHSVTADGTILTGIDSMLAAYPLAGHGALVWPLRMPLLRPLLSSMYLLFARHRYTLSRWLGYKAMQCEHDVCSVGNPFLRDRSKS